MASIELKGVDKVFEGGAHAVRDLGLTVADGELLVLLGPSGCGKSTVLRLIAGLEALTSGEILVGGRRVDSLPPQDRDVAMVFQSYALYGHMTVLENLEFPLRMRGSPKGVRRGRALEVARLLELEEILDQRPAALSGGQQQRVAMGRALVREPRAFLMDEPLSNLDARLRSHVRAHIAEIQKRLAVTTVYVTHDQVEALSLGHRVAVMRNGRLQQIGGGQLLYDRPANTFVAQFLGQPGMNLLKGRLVRTGVRASVHLGNEGEVELATPWPVAPDPMGASSDLADVIVGVRPEDLELHDAPGDGELRGLGSAHVRGRIRAVESLGAERLVHVEASAQVVHATEEGPPARSADDARTVRSRDGDTEAIIVRTGARGPEPKVGDLVSVRPRSPDLVRLFGAGGGALEGRAR